jgi:hypothetical protein
VWIAIVAAVAVFLLVLVVAVVIRRRHKSSHAVLQMSTFEGGTILMSGNPLFIAGSMARKSPMMPMTQNDLYEGGPANNKTLNTLYEGGAPDRPFYEDGMYATPAGGAYEICLTHDGQAFGVPVCEVVPRDGVN